MLLPSALSGDLPQASSGCSSSIPLSSPILSPQDDVASSNPVISNVYNTCCALQRMLVPLRTQSIPMRGLSTLPLQTYHSSKIRSRKRIGVPADRSRECLMRRRKYTTRATLTRCMCKQVRNTTDEEIPYDIKGVGMGSENDASEKKLLHHNDKENGPKTPQRMIYAPEILPFGIQHSDFLDLKRQEISCLCRDNQILSDNYDINNARSSEEDGLLVHLLRQKLKLTRNEWYESAYSFRREHLSLNKRW